MIAEILNNELAEYPPARATKWTEGTIQKYLQKFRTEYAIPTQSTAQELIWTTRTVPRGFWRNPENRRNYMDWLGDRLGYKNPHDWYNISSEMFQYNFGQAILRSYYDNSPIKALHEYYPDMEWHEWLLRNPSRNYWKDPLNRSQFMTWLGKRKGITQPEDWYDLTYDDYYENRGGGLFSAYYKGSTLDAVREYLPDYEWLPWRFKSTPKGFWEDASNRRNYLEWLFKKLDIMNPEDGYRLTAESIKINYGGGMLNHYYNSSPVAVLSEFFPGYEWQEWRFDVVPRSYWRNTSNVKRYLNWLSNELGFQKTEDWYSLTGKDIKRNFGSALLLPRSMYASIHKLVSAHIPNPNGWDRVKFDKKSTKRQKHLYSIVRELYPEKDVHYNFQHWELRFKSGSSMQLDIFVPPDLAIEYQGELHYVSVKYYGGDEGLRKRTAWDQEKRIACKNAGITLLEIPYTWNGNKNEIVARLRDAGFLS